MDPMTSLIRPFSGFIPSADFARRIVGPPTSMLTKEQKKASLGDDLSFRNVVGRSARANREEAASWLHRCRELDALQPVEPCVIAHRMKRRGAAATGLIAEVSIAAYENGLVKPHEKTIPKTQRKMLEYMQSTRIFGNPVALAHHDHAGVAGVIATQALCAADLEFQSIDGTEHTLWVIAGEAAWSLCNDLSNTLYITDGHHRLAAASALATAESMADLHLPAGLFAASQLQLGSFARTIRDPSVVGSEVVAALYERFEVVASDQLVPRPSHRHQIGARIDGQSFLIALASEKIPADTYDQLAVNLLQALVLEPLFGVSNQRTDQRLQFVADGGDDDAHVVDSYDAWFLPHPEAVADVMAVADSGRSMPPKSTYFLPKIPSGLVVRPVDSPT